MAKSKKSVVSNGEKVGIGVALTTAAVAAAGAYFLYSSPNAAKNRKKVKGWMLKAKGEMLEVLEKAGKMTAEEYQQAVEVVAAGYKTVSKADISDFKKEMMTHWQKIAKQAAPAKKAAKKVVKKVAKAAKKAV